jgi:hypothetical protein
MNEGERKPYIYDYIDKKELRKLFGPYLTTRSLEWRYQMRNTIIALVLLFAIAGAATAASDGKILSFSMGVLTSEDGKNDVQISGENLTITNIMSEYSNTELSSVGWKLSRFSEAAEKIVNQYPGRFHIIRIIIWDATGKKGLALASLTI